MALNIKMMEFLLKITNAIPIGKVDMSAGSTTPNGWLLCNGQEVSRTTYAALFSVIGTTYGAGNGSTTFNVPNFTDRMPVGAGNLYSPNSSGGNKDSIVPYHNHSVNAASAGSHDHGSRTVSYSFRSRRQGANYQSFWGVSNVSVAANSSKVTSNGVGTSNQNSDQVTLSASHTHDSVTINMPAHNTNYAGTDGNTTNANMPPYRGINFIIYAG